MDKCVCKYKRKLNARVEHEPTKAALFYIIKIKLKKVLHMYYVGYKN